MKLEHLKSGDVLIADDAFTCLRWLQRCVVYQDHGGRKFVNCADGKHYLDGQEMKSGHIIGFVYESRIQDVFTEEYQNAMEDGAEQSHRNNAAAVATPDMIGNQE